MHDQAPLNACCEYAHTHQFGLCHFCRCRSMLCIAAPKVRLRLSTADCTLCCSPPHMLSSDLASNRC